MNLTLRQLEYLCAVEQHRSFRRAAEACHISQPGISTQVRRLEQALGLQLFERDHHHVAVTPAGEALARRARGILHKVRELTHEATRLREPMSGFLRLGAIPTVGPYLLPRVVPLLRERFPGMRLVFQEAETADLVAALGRGELDAAFLALGVSPVGLVERELFTDTFSVIAPRAHALAALDQVELPDLDAEEVLLLAEGHCLRDQALHFCHQAGAGEVPDVRATSIGTLVRMVSCGVGISLLPALARGEVLEQDEIAVVPIAPPAPSRVIGLVWKPDTAHEGELLRLCDLLQTAEPWRTQSPNRR